MVRMPNGNVVAFLEGLERIRVIEVLGFKPFLNASVESQPDLEDQRDAELTALWSATCRSCSATSWLVRRNFPTTCRPK